MEKEFWIKRWENKEIGFHQLEINPFLKKYGNSFFKDSKTVFVPLSGKTKDMLWFLKRKHYVLGIEISKIACTEFFSENQIEYTEEKHKDFVFYISKNNSIFLIQGDFFSLTKEVFHSFSLEIDAIYDRASLIALPKDLRILYVQQMRNLFPKIPIYFLINMEYTLKPEIQTLYKEQEYGPPFSVSEKEIFELFWQYPNIQIIEKIPFKKANTIYAEEKLYFLKK
ncbi:MAG: hypothetical protein ACK4UJ_04240 [Leptonema sp. (in: bacteria)]